MTWFQVFLIMASIWYNIYVSGGRRDLVHQAFTILWFLLALSHGLKLLFGVPYD